ncbi:cytochrome P450 [Glaciimonas soli]|uniref:cytochrome P450 n=1 Tax=Glaciimonas soli TaxID=2590999 RepID=UPI002AD4F89D|nr:cytochrome P450 [Glaciimonas soli]
MQQGRFIGARNFVVGAWLLTNYADVANVLRDPNFSVQRASRWVNGSGPGARAELREFKRILSRSLIFLDGSQHTRLRQVMNAGFKPAALQSMGSRVQLIVDRLLDSLDANDEMDFIRDFARPLPAMVIADMLRVNASDHADFIAWSDDIAAFIGSPTPSLEIARRAQTGLVALNEYFCALLPERRLHPGADLVSQLILAEEAGGIITTKELLAQCCTLLFAGHETTRNLLGNGLFALLNDREQWQILKNNPTLMPSALKELLRFESPVQYTGRRVMADIALHGHRLKKGDLVIPMIGAANRDPAKFSNPDTINLTRNEGSHLSFGYGPHVCIGATFTYMEAEIAFNTLMRRLPNLELVNATPKWGSNSVYRGLIMLPVRLARSVAG